MVLQQRGALPHHHGAGVFALLCAVILLGPEPQEGSAPPHERGRVVLPSLADKEGSVAVTFKGVSSTFPLCLVSMELVAQCDARRYRIEPGWVPRSLNQEADDLTTDEFRHFDPSKRIPVDLEALGFEMMMELFKVGDAYVAELEAHRAAEQRKSEARKARDNQQDRSEAKKRKKLKESAPWL